MGERNVSGTRRRWPKIVGGLAGIFIVLLVVLYFVATSEGFLKRFILPRVSDSLNADVTVQAASISPFSKVTLRQLKVVPRGAEPLFWAEEVRAQYSLMKIIRGNIDVEEVFVSAATIEVIQHPNGKSNLDPILEAQKKTEKDTTPKKEPGEATRLQIRNVTLQNGTVRQINNLEGNQREVTELTGINLTVTNVQNAQMGGMNLASALRMNKTNGVMEGNIGAQFTFDLGSKLEPRGLAGEMKMQIEQATGGFAEVNGLQANLVADATPSEVRNMALRFSKGANTLGEVRVAGPFDLAKTEGRLNMEVLSIDRQVLNLTGHDFGKTTINSSNQIELTQGGGVIAAIGKVDIAQFALARTNANTPPLDIQANYNVTVDRGGQAAKVQSLALVGRQGGQKEIIQLDLPSPMTVTWGQNVVPTGDSALNLSVNELNMADWTPFLGELPVREGVVTTMAKVTSQESGKQLRLDVTSRIDRVVAVIGTNEIRDAGVVAHLRGTFTDLMRLKISHLQVQATHRNQAVMTLNSTGQHDTQSKSSDLQLALETSLPQALGMLPQPDLRATSGNFTFNGRVLVDQDSQTVTGTMALANFTGQVSENKFAQYNVQSAFNIEKRGDTATIRQMAGTITEGAQVGGKFDLKGSHNAKTGAAQLTARLDGLNENALEPFLAAALAEKKLVSVTLNGSADVQYDPAGKSDIKTEVHMSNLVVNDPAKKIPATPLEAKFQLATAIDKKVVDLKQAKFTLTPTAKAKNEFNLSGRIDMTRSNALEGALKISAESLDVTTYYDIFAGGTNAAEAQNKPAVATTTTANTIPAVSTTNAAPSPLPIRDFKLDCSIGRLIFRELELSNIKAAPHVESRRVRTGPMRMVINGGPVELGADINLAVPGYGYALTTTMERVPLEPLVNTFMPEQKGKAKGELYARANINGTGMSGADLQKNLKGETSFNLTNANVQISSSKFVSKIISAAAIYLKLPELTESPLQEIRVDAKMGAQVMVQPIHLVSALFSVETGGGIQLANVLTNSTIQSWPVTISVRSNLAQRLPKGFAESGGEYQKLPNIMKIAGTIGAPDVIADKAGLARLAVDQGISRLGLDNKTESAVKGVTGLLLGRPGNTNAASTTNQAGTNLPPASNPLDLFKRLKK